MQVKTNAGPVTLAPSDIQNGMVFRDPTDNDTNIFRADPALYTDGIAGMQEVAEALAADVAAGKVYFLGCDPRLTSRAGCERFGVSSTVDAAAHGFARLRDGGAVDLRVRGNVPKGTIISHEYGSRITFDELLGAKVALGVNARFIGLNADYVDPDVVRRLCCCTKHASYEQLRCTLAIGDHDTHEDLATGAKWQAAVDPKPKLIVGVDPAMASPSPTGTAWPFKDANDIMLRFADVPSGVNLFTLRDMFTQMGRVRFTLRAGDGTMARYEAMPNEVKTSPNYRLADATNIEARVVDVRRVETSDEWWTKEKPATAADIIRRRLNQPIVYAVPKGGAHEELTNWLAAEMSKAISGDQGQYAIGPVHQAFTYPIVPTTKTTDYINVWRPSALMTAIAPREVAPVPNGCDPARWRAVVNVIQADVQEAAQHRKRHGESYDRDAQLHDYLTRAAERMSAYAVLRFVHRYDAKEASRRACEKDGGTVYYSRHERLCRVYEAG